MRIAFLLAGLDEKVGDGVALTMSLVNGCLGPGKCDGLKVIASTKLFKDRLR